MVYVVFVYVVSMQERRGEERRLCSSYCHFSFKSYSLIVLAVISEKCNLISTT